jgi:hypothetical protein
MVRALRARLTLLSFVVAVLALFATWWQGWTAWDTERRSLRAYVTYDDPLVTSVTNSAGAIVEWKILPKWANHGGTPTRNLISELHCISARKDTLAIIGESKQSSAPRDLSPGSPIGAGFCSSPADQLAADGVAGILHGARSTADYFDVFGEPHHSEQCFVVDFLIDPLHFADAKRTINQCERNCEDEECQTAPARASLRSLLFLDRLMGRKPSPPGP